MSLKLRDTTVVTSLQQLRTPLHLLELNRSYVYIQRLLSFILLQRWDHTKVITASLFMIGVNNAVVRAEEGKKFFITKANVGNII